MTDPSAPPDLRRTRLARALGAFFEGGSGPTHRDLTHVFNDVRIHEEPGQAVKWERVETAVRSATSEQRLWNLIARMVDLLGSQGELTPDILPPPATNRTQIDRLRSALQAYGRDFTDDGTITGGGRPRLTATSAVTVDVLREHIERLHAAAGRDDAPAVIGTAKELVESAVEVVLRDVGVQHDAKDPLAKRAKLAQKALGLHGSQHDTGDDFTKLVKQLLSSLSTLATTVTEFRNLGGTGHGRSEPVRGLTHRHAKLVAGAAIVYSEMLIDTLADPAAPWRRRNNLTS